MMRRVATVAALASVISFMGGPSIAAASTTTYTPLVQGWEQFFRITWQPMERNGVPYVAGYVSNAWGFPARHVQLLVDGLDASGRVVSQQIGWLGGELTPGSRAYFELRAPQPAATYRVSVFAFDWIQSASVQAP